MRGIRRDSHEVAVEVEQQCTVAYTELKRAQDAINKIIGLGWGDGLGYLANVDKHLEIAFNELNNARTWVNKEYGELPQDVQRWGIARPEVTDAQIAELTQEQHA